MRRLKILGLYAGLGLATAAVPCRAGLVGPDMEPSSLGQTASSSWDRSALLVPVDGLETASEGPLPRSSQLRRGEEPGTEEAASRQRDGLFAALFAGGTTQGGHPADIVLIGVLLLGSFALLRAMRRIQSDPLAEAVGFRHRRDAQRRRSSTGVRSDLRQMTPAPGGLVRGCRQGQDEWPIWLDGTRLLEEGKLLFIRVQAAWDHTDISSVETDLTRDLADQLKRARAARPDPQLTEVVRLHSELLCSAKQGDQVLASLVFDGLIVDDDTGSSQEIRQVWHLLHDWQSPEGPWRAAGIAAAHA